LIKKPCDPAIANELKGKQMSESNHIVADQVVVFTLDGQFYALPLHTVLRVIHSIEIRHLPEAPEIIIGIINIKGRIIPVADLRKRLGLPPHEINPDDQLIIAGTGKREIAVPVDFVTGIRDLSPIQMDVANETIALAEQISGVTKLGDELVLIYDLECFLSLDEEDKLVQAINNAGNES
jgi:purine-binding chemotaxis protein CheW